MSSEFDYSKLDPETEMNLKQNEKEIQKHMETLGTACWNAGRIMIGNNSTPEQISNFLSVQWGYDKEIILIAMDRVKKPWN